MDYSFEANIIRSLGKIIEKGHLKRGDKPVHWCFDCKSALAEAEVEYQEKLSTSIDFLFPIENALLKKILIQIAKIILCSQVGQQRLDLARKS